MDSQGVWSFSVHQACTASGAVPTAGQVGVPVQFQGSGSPGTTYDWDFGDGTPHSTQQNPQHLYTKNGDMLWRMTTTTNGTSCIQKGVIRLNYPSLAKINIAGPGGVSIGTQTASQPFDVLIQTVDSNNQIISNFNETVSLGTNYPASLLNRNEVKLTNGSATVSLRVKIPT